MSSFGDWVALSDTCDAVTATILKREVSDGIIAPDYTEEALEILKTKKKGNYNIVKIDPDFVPMEQETKQVFGITFEQGRNDYKITPDQLTKHRYGKQRSARGGEARPDHRTDYPQIHPVQLGRLCKGRTGHRRRRRTAVQDPLHQTGRKQSGLLASETGGYRNQPAFQRRCDQTEPR